MMKQNSLLLELLLVAVVLSWELATAWTNPPPSSRRFRAAAILKRSKTTTASPTFLFMADDDEENEDEQQSEKLSLEEKMKSWEASEEEIKAATLGGIVPGSERSDAFDVGLWILFPLMVGSGLLFAFFPLIMGNIDVGDVGPPPTS
jgi:hypothetical protein